MKKNLKLTLLPLHSLQAPGEECSTVVKSDWENRTVVKVSWCEPLETVSAKAREYVDDRTKTTTDYLEAITASLGLFMTSLLGLGKLPFPAQINTE